MGNPTNQSDQKISLPHNFNPRWYQKNVLWAIDRGYRRLVLVWHRRAGKDMIAFNIAIREMVQKVGICYYILPSYVQGKKVIWDAITKDGLRFLDFIPKKLIADVSASAMQIRLYNGSIIQVVGSDNIDSLVGTNPSLCIFSEYALQHPRAWDLLRPILTENGGTAIFMFTPRGMNHAWHLLKTAEQSSHWYTSRLTVEDTGVIPSEEIEKEKAEMSEDFFYQEYYCEFTQGDAQVFRRVHEAVGTHALVPERGKKYVLGIDVGKRHDYTVITPINLGTFQVGTPIVIRTMDYPQQERHIVYEYHRWNRAQVWIDATGVGEPLADFLSRSIKLKRFYFTERTREELLERLKLSIETQKISLPNDKQLIEELLSFQYVGHGIKNRMEAPSGLHDDLVMSLALACWDLPRHPLRSPTDGSGKLDFLEFDANKGKSPNQRNALWRLQQRMEARGMR
jgi:hypothetical protein